MKRDQVSSCEEVLGKILKNSISTLQATDI